ncbi:MAG: prepilin-type N-terminal cleavage/methylation domain-containing protein [Bacilli bacterium]|nr:prepilin-type N-terminal cleavage/methylation domain-containing protein [Bacilli bacterium]
MKNKKGFTLIELLAVIAILAILLILAIPNVLKLFNNAKKNSFVTESQSILSTAQKQYMSDQVSSGAPVTTRCFDGTNNSHNELSLSGNNDTKYYIEYGNGKITKVIVNSNGYSITKEDASGIDASDLTNAIVKSSSDEEYTEVTCTAGGTTTVSTIDYGSATKETIAPGETLTIGGKERFMVLTNDNGNILAIPYYNLYIADALEEENLDNVTIVQATPSNAGTGEGTAGVTAFSTEQYWTVGEDEIDMDDERNKVQPYIEAYQRTLESLGATGITVRIGKYSEINAVSISLRNPSEIGYYWLGSGLYNVNSTHAGTVRTVFASGTLGYCNFNARGPYYGSGNVGVRPVLIIN